MAIYVYDKSGNKKAWAGAEDDASLAKFGLSKTQPTTGYIKETKTNPTINYNNSNGGSSSDYPTSGSVWVTRPDGSQTAASARDLQKLLAKGYSYAGVRTNDSGLYSSNGDLIQSKSKSSGGSSGGNNDMLDEINRLRKQRINSRKAALGGLRDKTLTGLATEKTNVKGQYYDAKNQESSSAQIRAKKLEELMAAKGYGAGTQAQNELAGNVSLQNTLGGLKRQEQSAYDDIAKRGTDAETEYQTGLVQAEADAETTASQARLAELGQQRDYSRQDEQTDYERSRQDLLDTRYDQENADAKLNNERSDFIKNTTMYSYPDIQAEINTIMNDNDTANDWKIPILKDIRGQKIEKQLNEEIKTAGQYSGNFQSEIARREKTSDPLDNALIPYLKAMMTEQQATPSERYKQLWDMFMKTGVITTDEMASVLGQPIGTTTTDYLQTKYNIGKPYSGGGSSSGSSSGAGGEVPWYLQ
jgi:hypothetical protein